MDHSRDSATIPLAVAASVLTGLLVGCSGSGTPEVVEEVSASTNYTTITGSLIVGDPSPVAPTAEVPPLVIPTLPDGMGGARASGSSSVGVTEVNVSGSSAVEYRLAGNGSVSYTVRYVDEAVRYGTSEPLAVPGKSVLQVDLSGASAESDDSFAPYTGPERIRVGADSAVVSVDFLADPDGISQSFIAVSTDRPEFTVTTTENPAAVIVTIAS